MRTVADGPLTAADIQHFLARGWVRLPAAFSREAADLGQDFVWEQLRLAGHDVYRDRPETWPSGDIHLTEVFQEPVFHACHTRRFISAVEQLLGPGRSEIADHWPNWGWWPVRFPRGGCFSLPTRGWHWDGQGFRHHLTMGDEGLLMVCLFSDVRAHGGATLVAENSHRLVARHLADFPAGLDHVTATRGCNASHPWLRRLVGLDAVPGDDRVAYFMAQTYRDDDGAELRVIEATGQAGDVYLLHPFTYHAANDNHCGPPRFICNRGAPLHHEQCLERPDGDYSVMELATRAAVSKSP